MSIGIKIDLNHSEKRVVIEYSEPVDMINFTPQQAIDYAEAILNKVMELAPKSIIELPHKMN